MAEVLHRILPSMPHKVAREPENGIRQATVAEEQAIRVDPDKKEPTMASNGTVSSRRAKAETVEIHIPDMFASFMSVEPALSPHYPRVKAEADAWIAKTLRFDGKQAHRNGLIDFTYLVSFWAPPCDAETLRNMVDWQHWAFPWDDQFDDGHLQKDLHAAAEEIIQMVALLDDELPLISAEDHPLRYAAQVNWKNFKKRASPALQRRYKKHMKEWMIGILGQVASQSLDPRTVAVEDYLTFRRRTIGVMPCTCLVESALGLDLPDEALDHPSIAVCQQIAADLTLLENDILSYNKDVINGQEMNLVKILEFKGRTLQEAVDEVTDMINACYPRWYRALAELPNWGADVDRAVLLYVEGLRNIVLGSLIWSFDRGRYFSKEDGERLRLNRVMPMLRSDPN